MGLIKAITGAAGGVLADEWREYFYAESLGADVLVTKGNKRVSKRSSNVKGTNNIISNGSVVAVNEGQCMIIVDQGKVAEFCAEPGEFLYDNSTEPSLFYGGLGKGILDTFKNIGKRFTFGGLAPKDQRVYYFNTKEIIGNKYGTANPVPFRVVDKNVGLDIDIAIRCHGEYSYKITNPLLFYANVSGNVESDYYRGQIDSQLRTELMTALQPAFAKISEMGIRYSALPGHTEELAEALNGVLSKKWGELRGIEIASFGISSVKAPEEDEELIKNLQKAAAFRDPTMAAANLTGAQADAMRAAASNEGGAMMGFMGLGMAQSVGGARASDLFAMGREDENQTPPKPARNTWQCACGKEGNLSKFCAECGSPAPAGQVGWKCDCGEVNKGKFCTNCGKKKPDDIPKYKCDKCGWEPDDPANPPKFCPECGDIFDEKDKI